MRCVVVIGASAGGVTALRSLVNALPADFPAPIAVVLHVGAHPSQLASLLAQGARIAVRTASHLEPLSPATVYVAPPDQHLLVNGDGIELMRGPLENHARPAIDPLFRSAAENFGPGAIGVVLTGRLNDGTAGLYELKRRGGTAVVQDPAEAEHPSMPRSALQHVAVDHVARIDDLAPLLVRLTHELADLPTTAPTEVNAMGAERAFRDPVAYTCPDCGGALERCDTGRLTAFRCHIGHKLTAEVLAEEQGQRLDEAVETTLRLTHERVDLAKLMLEDAKRLEDLDAVVRWQAAQREAEELLETLLVASSRFDASA